MYSADYAKMYAKISAILGDLTPLTADCGRLCGGACCKGDETLGMRLFPFEQTTLMVHTLENGVRLAVCDGSCNRNERPLACKIFPFFPTIDAHGKIYVEADYRGAAVCPLVTHTDQVLFDKNFLKAVKKVGKILAKDSETRAFLYETTAEMDTYAQFLKR